MRRMLNLYRRHQDACQHKAKGRNWNRCACGIWVDGRVEGHRYTRSLKTTDWQVALRKIKAMEDGASPLLRSVKACVDEWEKTLEIAPATKRKYMRLARQLEAWCSANQVTALADLNVETLSQFRSSREIERSTSSRELQTLRQFFGFCLARGWIGENPAKAIKAPKGKPVPVLPFSAREMAAILEACDRLGQSAYERLRARALVLVMRYTGLSIGDALMLRKDALQPDGYLVVHRRKTGQMVRMRVPDGLVLALQRVPDAISHAGAGQKTTCNALVQHQEAPGRDSGYFFWNGKIGHRALLGVAERVMVRLKQLSGVPDFHAHRFRHTLAVSILAEGGTIEDVARVLGNTPAVAYRHYSPYCKQIEQRIDRLMEKVNLGDAAQTPKKFERIM